MVCICGLIIIHKRTSLMDSSIPTLFYWSLNKLERQKTIEPSFVIELHLTCSPESIIHRILKGSGELQHEQISLFCAYLITGPLEAKRDFKAV